MNGRSLRVAFAGTPEFAARALDAVLASRHRVERVLTQPDRPAGRGLRVQPSPVKELAMARGIAVSQPRSLKLDGRWPDDAAQARTDLQQTAPDVMVVVAYGLILPEWVLQVPPQGCVNIHASLLPRWRGAAPIQRAIEAGDPVTGVTIMQMDEGLDTGPMLLRQEVPIAAEETSATLHDRLAACGAALIVQALDRLAEDGLVATAQPDHGHTYAAKIAKEEGAIDWSLSAVILERRIRAFDPFPGCVCMNGDVPLKVWSARAEEPTGPLGVPTTDAKGSAQAPGTVLDIGPDGMRVACGQGMLRITQVQRPGGRRQPAAEAARALNLHAGVRLR